MEDNIIEIKCENCGHTKSIRTKTDFFECGECLSCHKMTYYKQLKPSQEKPIVRCPYCNSWNTQKISTSSKVGSVALFGIFAAGKATKQWHCNECKSDF